MLIYYGSKKRIAKDIIKYFPKHNAYIEVFFGGGNLFFNKPKVEYNMVNDINNNVYNFFRCWQDDKEKLKYYIQITPICNNLKEMINKQVVDLDFKQAAAYGIVCSYFVFQKMLRTNPTVNFKKYLLERIDELFYYSSNTIILNYDYRKFIKSISFRHERDKKRAFIYADPPYLDTKNFYKSDYWNIENFEILIQLLLSKNIKFAISETNHKKVLEVVRKYNLYKYEIKSIRNGGLRDSKRIEMLYTNYLVEDNNEQKQLF